MKSYEITIKLDNSGGGRGAHEAISGTTAPSPSATASSGQASQGGGGSLKTALGAVFSYATIKSFATQQINYGVSITGLRTGSNELQQKASFYNQIAQKGLGIAETTLAGFAVGNVPGALIGLAVSTTHTLIGFGQAQNTINLNRTLENRSLEMTRIRAGAQGSRSVAQ